MKEVIFIWKKTFAASQNEHAYTLVEMLFAFLIFTIIIFFISPLFSITLQYNDFQKRLQAMEWDVFCSQIKKEIRMSTKVQVISNRLILTEDAGTVVFEKYENILRRRVNNTGHEVLLQNISQASFTSMPGTIKVTVRDLDDKEYVISIFTFVY